MLTMRIGARLKKLRETRGINQTTLAKKVRVTQAYVAMLESGRGNPTLDVLQRLAKALKSTVAELVK